MLIFTDYSEITSIFFFLYNSFSHNAISLYLNWPSQIFHQINDQTHFLTFWEKPLIGDWHLLCSSRVHSSVIFISLLIACSTTVLAGNTFRWKSTWFLCNLSSTIIRMCHKTAARSWPTSTHTHVHHGQGLNFLL